MPCISPIYVNKKGIRNFVPCGKCHYCKDAKRNEWSFRLFQEWKVSHSAMFITLTYKDAYLPLKEHPPLSGAFVPVLDKKDVQNFIKRLRSLVERERRYYKDSADQCWKQKIRYFAVGEYGDSFDRPHYHLLIFNVPVELMVNGVEKCWKKGIIDIGEVEPASIHYCAKYCLKQGNLALMIVTGKH